MRVCVFFFFPLILEAHMQLFDLSSVGMHALAKSSVRARLPLRQISHCKASICSILSKGSALNTRQSSAKNIILEDFGLVQQKMAESLWCAVKALLSSRML